MKQRYWKYWRISKSDCENVVVAQRDAPAGYTTHRHTVGQYVFRKRLPTHLIKGRLADTAPHWEVDTKAAPYA